MSSHNSCGECTACCHRWAIPEVTWMDEDVKPKDTLCDKYCNGCTIYEERPKVCADFECVWLKINSVNNSLPVSLRPDNCDVMVTARFDEGVGHLLLDELAAGTFDIANMTPAQTRLVMEIIKLIENQSIPTELFLRTYEWDVKKVNIHTDKQAEE